ncbi:MAG: hypothetical protein ACKV2T_18165 [Kofleriaceae bacterium]
MTRQSAGASVGVHWLGLAVVLAVAGCLGSSDDKGTEEPLPDESAADSFRSPTEQGGIEFGVPAIARLTAAERYHAWTFELSGSARVDMTTSYAVLGQHRVDTVLYLYKEGTTGWGSYVARNDDYGSTVYSQLVRELGAGRYRVLVKGYAATTRGRFKLTTNCTGEGCVATCLFGDTPTEMLGAGFSSLSFTRIESASGLSAALQEQVVAAARLADSTVMTPAAAIALGGFVERSEIIRDVTGTPYALITVPVGGTTGALFRGGTTTVAAEVRNSAFARCHERRLSGGAQIGEDCGQCANGLVCLGKVGGVGTCVPEVEPEGVGASCTSDAECPTTELVCGGLGNTPREGICVSKVMRRRFDDDAVTPINGDSTRTIAVYGLATVAMDVAIAANIVNVVPSQTIVRLTNPAGTESTVWDGPALLAGNPDIDSDNFIELIQYVDGFPGDESANGTYALRVNSIAGGEVADWHLTITSRFD